jgi:ribosomal protein S18 acetylase RimI-like enzyme
MSNCKIEFLDKLPEALEKKMSDGMDQYDHENGIDVNYKIFSITSADQEDQVVGVLKAYTAFAEIYIDDLWVDSLCRNKGYGRKLLLALEDQFIGKGFNNINLVTSAFSAPGFYQKCGFTAEFTRKNLHNPKLNKTFFVKYFDDSVQTQGLLKKENS